MYKNLIDAILDSLADGPRTVELIERSLKADHVTYNKDKLLNTLIDMLNKGLISVDYPPYK